MSDAESTSTAAVANVAVAVGKGVSWESAAKDFVRNGGASFVIIAGLLVGNTISIGLTNANMEKYAGQTNTNIEKTNLKIEKTNTNMEKYAGETNLKIEKLSSDTKVSLVELRYGLDKKIDTTSGRLMWGVVASVVIGFFSLFKYEKSS